MNKEHIGTSIVETLLARTNLLDADIHKGDKWPTWDGEVYVYKNPNKTTDCLLGRVPVQIKCKEDIRNNNTLYWEYSVKLSDIKNYYNDGGAIYFVVKTDGTNEIIYHKILLPVDLLPIIKFYGNQKERILGFKKFPTDIIEVQNIFIDFLHHKNLQSSLNQMGFRSVEELRDAGYTEMFFEARVKDPLDIVGKEVYQYVRHPLGNIACVNKIDIKGIKNIPNPNKRLIIAGHTYFTGFKIDKTINHDKTINQMEITFGSKNVILIFENEQPKSFSLNLRGTLLEHLNSLQFIIDADKHKGFSIENIEFKVGKIEHCGIEHKQAMQDFSNNLIILEKIKALFNFMNFNVDIELTESLINQLFAIAGSVLEDKSVGIKNATPYGLLRLHINDNFLMFRTIKQADGKYIIRDLFKHDIPPLTCEKDVPTNTPESHHSSFLLLHEKDFYTALNLDFSIIHKDILSYLDGKNCIEALELILVHYWFKLVKAFDITNNPLFFDLAKETLERLKTVPNIPDIQKDSLYLNDIQLIKRQRALNKDEILTLNEFIKNTTSTEHLVAGYLLKDDMINANTEFSKLSTDEKDRFKTYPMYKFWKK